MVHLPALLKAAMDPARIDRSQLLLPHFLCNANSDADVEVRSKSRDQRSSPLQTRADIGNQCSRH